MKSGRTLSVIGGGASSHAPRVLAVGLERSALTRDERDALSRAHGRGLRIIVFTALDPGEADVAFKAIRSWATVIPARSCARSASPLSPRAARANVLAECLASNGRGFGSAAVIATSPTDLGMLMTAGVAFALEGAGYDVLAVADRVFPAREAGGLVQAVDAACALAAGSYEGAPHPSGSAPSNG